MDVVIIMFVVIVVRGVPPSRPPPSRYFSAPFDDETPSSFLRAQGSGGERERGVFNTHNKNTVTHHELVVVLEEQGPLGGVQRRGDLLRLNREVLRHLRLSLESGRERGTQSTVSEESRKGERRRRFCRWRSFCAKLGYSMFFFLFCHTRTRDGGVWAKDNAVHS